MKGIIVGTDQNLEWMLPWWWENYSETNNLPVAFADFGMSEEAKNWCEERGCVFPIYLSQEKVATLQQCNQEALKIWGDKCPSYTWEARAGWFKKPLAMQQCPFETGVWLDLDCEVMDNVEGIFQYIDPVLGLTLVPEPDYLQVKRQLTKMRLPGERGFNSGVVGFHRNSSLLKKWVEGCLTRNHEFIGDQEILSRILFEEGHQLQELPEIYNWLVGNPDFLDDAVIVHWAGIPKILLRDFGMMTRINLKFRVNICIDRLCQLSK